MSDHPFGPAAARHRDRRSEAELLAAVGLPPAGAPPQIRICDFCVDFTTPKAAQVPATWYYPAGPMRIPIGGVPVEIEMPGLPDGWAACDSCHDLIEAGDDRALAEHLGYASGPLPSGLRRFREAQLGPAQRL